MRKTISSFTKEQLQIAVDNSNSYGEVLIKLGVFNQGRNLNTLYKALKDNNVDLENFLDRRYLHLRNPKNSNKAKDYSDILVVNSPYQNSSSLKKRLIKDGLIVNQCAICGLTNEWNGKKLSLQLDHINGVHNDNRIENLRLLCPNCHSQTDNFSGKSLLGTGLKCSICNKQISFRNKSGVCRSCASIGNKNSFGKNRKVERPTKEVLLDLLENNSYTAVGKMYGVSDNAIRKWLK